MKVGQRSTRLAIEGGPPALALAEMPAPHYRWPPVTAATERAVLRQLRESISIKDRSGVVAELEDRFRALCSRAFAISFNSGTAALFAAYDALRLGPGDEVLCPDYTWFATVSPLVYTGATPVFIDCDHNLNLDPDLLGKHLTPRTKAVVVTHMWGMPAAMLDIAQFCKANGLLLVEDCSHAHGASRGGRPVGSFGNCSVFSLQAAKAVPAGEGGVLLMDEPELYYRANLHGHYNKRCAQEIPSGVDLRNFWQTGFGLKQRIHPLGAALALHYFELLPGILERRRACAARFLTIIGRYPFLQPQLEKDSRSSWYRIACQFVATATSVSAQDFLHALHAEGLVEFDIPTLTGPIGDLYLFNHLEEALPRLYSSHIPTRRNCPRSQALREMVLVLPVWSEANEEPIVQRYAEGLEKVCQWAAEQR